MSKEISSPKESSTTPSADPRGKRRVTKSRSAKSAISAEATNSSPDEPSPEKPAPAFPVFDEIEPAISTESPDTTAFLESSPQEKTKRKRRRKKGKGAGSQNNSQLTPGEPSHDSDSEAPSEPAAYSQHPERKKRPKLESDSVTKLAWKIYLAEVSEEGVALIGDNDARELSRRCFRLAEIFMEEQSRRN
jgi:hypothetical protein